MKSYRLMPAAFLRKIGKYQYLRIFKIVFFYKILSYSLTSYTRNEI